ncbi:MAG: GtrA family protein [Aliihoeflea sp.]
MKRIASFGFVGAIGFVVDAAALALILMSLAMDPFVARLLSMAIALTATWLLNRTLTFGASDRPMAVEGVRYGGVGILSGIVNYLVYSAALLILPSLHPLLALVAGSAAAMVFSYLGYSRLVFDRRPGPAAD